MVIRNMGTQPPLEIARPANVDDLTIFREYVDTGQILLRDNALFHQRRSGAELFKRVPDGLGSLAKSVFISTELQKS